jgi:hypothetical protein
MYYTPPKEFVDAQWEIANRRLEVAAAALRWILTRAG